MRFWASKSLRVLKSWCSNNAKVLRGHDRAMSFLEFLLKESYFCILRLNFYLFIYLNFFLTAAHSFSVGGTMMGTGLKQAVGGLKSLLMFLFSLVHTTEMAVLSVFW